MRAFKKLVTFPREDEAVLKGAAEATGLSVNQIIVQAVHERVPAILAEHRKVDLSPLSESAVARAYGAMSEEEIATDRALGRASLKAQRR